MGSSGRLSISSSILSLCGWPRHGRTYGASTDAHSRVQDVAVQEHGHHERIGNRKGRGKGAVEGDDAWANSLDKARIAFVAVLLTLCPPPK